MITTIFPEAKNCLTCDKEFHRKYWVSLSRWNETVGYCSTRCKGISIRGKKLSREHRNKMSIAKLGKPTWNKGLKGVPSGRKGERVPSMQGSNHPNWKGGVTTQYKKDRRYFAVNISPRVFERDNYTCQICFAEGVFLHADHIKTWREYPELKFEVSNCRTLCRPCHYYVTYKRSMPANSKWGGKRLVANGKL